MRFASMPRLFAVSLTLSLLALPSATEAHGTLHTRIASITERLTENPKDARLYGHRAELRCEHGDVRAALADLEAARRLEPSWADVDLVLARCMLRRERIGAAKNAIVAFRRRAPDDLAGLELEAQIASRLKLWTEAEALYVELTRRAERLDPDHYVRAAEAIVNQGDAHIARALRLLDEGIARLGGTPVLRERAIHLARQMGDHEGALQRVDVAAKDAQHGERWLALRGDILSERGLFEEARAAYEAALAALAARPDARRQSPAFVDLRTRIEASLSRLSKPARK